jgi:hypothetical protein
MLHAVALVVRLFEGVEQFRDHPLEHVRIVGQTRFVRRRGRCCCRRSGRFGFGRRVRAKGNVRVHAFLDDPMRRRVHEKLRKAAELAKKASRVATATTRCHSEVTRRSWTSRASAAGIASDA